MCVTIVEDCLHQIYVISAVIYANAHTATAAYKITTTKARKMFVRYYLSFLDAGKASLTPVLVLVVTVFLIRNGKLRNSIHIHVFIPVLDF